MVFCSDVICIVGDDGFLIAVAIEEHSASQVCNHLVLVVELFLRLLRWPSSLSGFQSRLGGSIHLAPPCHSKLVPRRVARKLPASRSSPDLMFSTLFTLPRQSAFHAVPPVHIVVKHVQIWLAGDPAPSLVSPLGIGCRSTFHILYHSTVGTLPRPRHGRGQYPSVRPNLVCLGSLVRQLPEKPHMLQQRNSVGLRT